jgi:D-xylose 1-dehydrogenase (NADP+, D-xylono-1,5-lactone-forming)
VTAEPVRWGILSTAHINRLVIPPAHESSLVELLGVASRDQRRAEKYARKWGIPRAYGSYEALLDDPDVEAIYNPLPNSMHVEWSIRALEAGKHVLCEKPLSRHLDDVERAFDLAERAGLALSEAFMYRHHPQARRLEELVAEGAIGALQTIRAAFSFSLSDPENIRLRAELEGGALMDVGCYCVNGTRLLGGEPERVYGEQAAGFTGVDVRFHGMLRFPSGVVGQFDCGLVLPVRDELEVIGDEGSLFLDDPWHCHEPMIELRRDGAVERIEIERVNSYRLELDNVSAAIRGEAELLLGRADAVGQARVIEALHRSAESGAAVTL